MKKLKFLSIIVFLMMIISFVWYFTISAISSITQKRNEVSKVTEEYQTNRLSTGKGELSTNIVTENAESIGKVQEFEDGYYITEKDMKIPILIYHSIEDKIPSGDIWNLCVTTATFEENIQTLLNEGYTFITFEDLCEYEKGTKKLPEKNIMITIDDGYKNNYEKAYPILQKYNVKANIFIITDYRDGSYMTWDEIREMYNSGLVKFYSHGKEHIDYSSISISKLKEDILSSHKLLEEQLNTEILKVFAYPSGKYTSKTTNALKSIGFEIQVLTKYGTVNKSRTLNLTDIGRIRVEDSTTGKQIINKINKASN